MTTPDHSDFAGYAAAGTRPVRRYLLLGALGLLSLGFLLFGPRLSVPKSPADKAGVRPPVAR
jgi:hypothetical protein